MKVRLNCSIMTIRNFDIEHGNELIGRLKKGGIFMPNLNWSKLSPIQLGRYAEYYAKMEFSSYGFEVYTSEVDDHGVDFVAKAPDSKKFYEVQVKSTRDYGYVLIPKSKMDLTDDRLVCYIHFLEGNLPDVFIIPATAWKNPNALLVDRKYDKPGQKSKPEWGIQMSRKNYKILEQYHSNLYFKN